MTDTNKSKESEATQEQSTPLSSTRRAVLLGSGTAGVAAAAGLLSKPSGNLGLIGTAHAQSGGSGKAELTSLNERPINMEAPAHLLDDKITPASRMFVRNNGLPPAATEIDEATWTLTIDGLVDTPLELTIDELKSRFETVTLQLQLECAGNGRKYFSPGASGNQWTFGAIGCPEWTGVRLADVLKAAGVQSSAVYTSHYGADVHLTGDPEKEPISRGVPIKKAMDPNNLIAWAINGEDMPLDNGHPLRLVVPGWPGSCSHKWLNRITLIDKVHDGAKMTGQAYRVPAYPVPPGTQVADEDMQIIESLPVKSLITMPETGARVTPRESFEVRGHAWAGDLTVDAVHVSTDHGQTWIEATLEAPANPYAWQHWSAEITLPQAGYFEVWARATDSEGHMQPATTPGWNPKGYLNNMQHRIALYAV